MFGMSSEIAETSGLGEKCKADIFVRGVISTNLKQL